MTTPRRTVHARVGAREKALLSRRVRRLAIEETDGFTLLVLPDVFNGVVFRTGLLLARLAEKRPVVEHARALDMGTGSGLGALFLARAGWNVAAVDVNPEAVRCARVNALLNRLEGRVEVKQGDLFAPLGRDRFGLVLFNPPFFAGTPRDLHDLAWRGADAFPLFLEGLPARLAPHGEALVVLSSHAPGQERTLYGAKGLSARLEETHDFGDETISLFSVTRSAGR